VKINDGPVQTLKPGEVFYEPPNALHAISRNASAAHPLRYLVIQVSDPTKPARSRSDPPQLFQFFGLKLIALTVAAIAARCFLDWRPRIHPAPHIDHRACGRQPRKRSSRRPPLFEIGRDAPP